MIVDGLIAKVFIPALIAPVLAFSVAGLAILVAYRMVGRLRPGPVTRGFRLEQMRRGRKTIGIIVMTTK